MKKKRVGFPKAEGCFVFTDGKQRCVGAVGRFPLDDDLGEYIRRQHRNLWVFGTDDGKEA